MTNPSETQKDNRKPFCADALPDVYRTSPGAAPAAITVTGGTEYAAFVQELLEAEEKRNTAMETRGIAVITTSGTLVTLLLGLAALVTRVQAFNVPVAALFVAGASGLAFVGAAVSAMLANMPRRGWALKPDCLTKELWLRWGSNQDEPVTKTTATRLRMWEAAHELTQAKAQFVFVATLLQAVAIAFLSIAVLVVLASG